MAATISSTGTSTRTSAVTMVDVRHVIWRVATDLRILRVLHGLITELLEQSLDADLLLFVYRNYVTQIEFVFLNHVTAVRKYAVRYMLDRNWSGATDQDAGGLRYLDLRDTSFTVLITYSPIWRGLSDNEKAAFCQTLKLNWGPAATIRDGAGTWATDRTYGSGGLGATRAVFRPI